jgi:hypothetical protein
MMQTGKGLEIQERGLKKLHTPEAIPQDLGEKNGYPGSSFASKRPGSIQVTDVLQENEPVRLLRPCGFRQMVSVFRVVVVSDYENNTSGARPIIYLVKKTKSPSPILLLVIRQRGIREDFFASFS